MVQISSLPARRSPETRKVLEHSPVRPTIAILATAQPGPETAATPVERLYEVVASSYQLTREASAACREA